MATRGTPHHHCTGSSGHATGSQVFIILKGSIKLGAREREDGRGRCSVCSARFMAHLKPIQNPDLRLWVIRLCQIMPIIPIRSERPHPYRFVGVSICRPHSHPAKHNTAPTATFPVTHQSYLLPRLVSTRPSAGPTLQKRSDPPLLAVSIWPCPRRRPARRPPPPLLSFRNGRKTGGYCDFIPHKRVLYD